MRCEDCRFYRHGVSSMSSVRYQEGFGECRKNAPRGPVQLAWSRAGSDDTHIVTLTPFPIVPHDDWCGEHVRKERDA